MKRVSLVLILLLAMSGIATADNLVPPPWDPQHPRATHAEWEFYTDNPVPAPDVYWNPNGGPIAAVMPGTGQAWLDEYEGRQGVWPLSGIADFTIPNFPEPLERKEIWLQITWSPEIDWDLIVPIVGETLHNPEVTLIGTTVLEAATTKTGVNWYHSTYHMIIYPNPEMENIRIGGSILIDEVVIDTICIPEPASISLLVAGLGALAARRKRK